MKTVDPKLLQVFADVVDQGSFTKAAEIRETNVSYVTRQIKKLESDLKSSLLNRSTRALALTETGKLVYENARQLNELVRNVSVISQKQSQSLLGALRVTSAVYLGKKFIFPIIEQICDQYPDLNIELQLCDEHVDIIKDRFDLAFRVWKPKDTDLVAQKLMDVHLLLAATPQFIATHGEPKTLDQLSPLPAIVYGRKGHHNKSFHYFDGAGKLCTFNINANLCINDAEQLNICASNHNRYYLPANFMVADQLEDDRLVRLLPDLKMPPEGAFYAIYPNRELSKPALLLIDKVKAVLAKKQLS